MIVLPSTTVATTAFLLLTINTVSTALIRLVLEDGAYIEKMIATRSTRQ